jgi:hypothetical protein
MSGGNAKNGMTCSQACFPAFSIEGNLGSLRAAGKFLQRLFGSLLADGRVDRPERLRHQLAKLSADVVQAVADQVHDASLYHHFEADPY